MWNMGGRLAILLGVMSFLAGLMPLEDSLLALLPF
jgi:hypothetical protein